MTEQLTERLYETQSHLCVFSAKVLECEELCEKNKKIYKIVLDKTAFFPEGGGQKADSGYFLKGEREFKDLYTTVEIKNVSDDESETESETKSETDSEVEPEIKTELSKEAVRVSDVQEKNGIVFHFCSCPMEVGETVTGFLDYELRFRRMQNHTGEHIVSGIIHKYFGFDNVGFHMGSEDVTLDINGVLDAEKLSFVEKEANKAVCSNVDVYAEVFSGDILDSMEYRSKLDIRENVRIVTVDGYDKCACCAPHVCKTGEIGIIKLTGYSSYKQGIRIHMLCGFDALEDYERKLSQIKLSTALLSVKPHEVSMGIERLLEENKKEKQESNSLKNMVASLLLEKAKADNKNCLFTDINDPVFLRFLATGGSEIFGVCAVFCMVSENNYRYVAVRSKNENLDMRTFAKEMNSALCGRGGGDFELVQGSVKAARADIEEFFKNSSR